ncbi:MAG: thiamine ABC transporter substrate-binding protein [Halodesulfurarchaeum sp.]|nr:thiamine ABC transporter substrate-binding protein [Halodesulfurarchaeum sp.]
MKRRTFIKSTGAAGVAAFAGCAGPEGGSDGGGNGTTTGTSGGTDDLSGTLRVATYEPFIDAPSVSPGEWVKNNFESAYPEATIEWLTPDSGLNHFIQQAQYDDRVEADVYVGLNADDLVRVDDKLGETALFDPIPGGELSNGDSVIDDLRFDPAGRAVPYDTGYISLVYDESEIDEPRTFEDLTDPAFEDALLLQNAQTSDPGRAFLLWTIANRGEQDYLDYWQALVDNGARVLGDWNAAYTAYSNEERPAVVSYSTDQVYANRYDEDMTRHQIAFLDDQGYAVPEGMARFADAAKPELATAFLDFMLEGETQSEIAVRNVGFPATTTANPPADFAEFAHRPPETVTHTYEELAGSMDGWVSAWAEQIAGG